MNGGSGKTTETEECSEIRMKTEDSSGVHLKTEECSGIRMKTEDSSGVHLKTEESSGIHMKNEDSSDVHLKTEESFPGSNGKTTVKTKKKGIASRCKKWDFCYREGFKAHHLLAELREAFKNYSKKHGDFQSKSVVALLDESKRHVYMDFKTLIDKSFFLRLKSIEPTTVSSWKNLKTDVFGLYVDLQHSSRYVIWDELHSEAEIEEPKIEENPDFLIKWSTNYPEVYLVMFQLLTKQFSVEEMLIYAYETHNRKILDVLVGELKPLWYDLSIHKPSDHIINGFTASLAEFVQKKKQEKNEKPPEERVYYKVVKNTEPKDFLI